MRPRTDRIERASIEIGWSSRRPYAAYLAVVQRMFEAGIDFRRFGSGALGLASVADGRADAYFEEHINAWDCLAGILLVEEAGGRVNDFLAGDGLRNGNPILAAAPGVADEIAALAGVPLLELIACGSAPGDQRYASIGEADADAGGKCQHPAGIAIDHEQLADRRSTSYSTWLPR